uniref:Uncharacterized protein n=1 Tax=Siphoviridae sp. ct2KB1 TaxID=2827768 RepID=A0A8S5SLL6_9CAUD|nr:MAG TPA: hypothetical protein [Siphoviridae sp. ct2KB1]DAM63547.1 MAG TPA: hypothetical protein [Caudoviricetes sp.]DAS32701.1 MAG TPA: hypothetical protein [Caudoviricetes sp.]
MLINGYMVDGLSHRFESCRSNCISVSSYHNRGTGR